MRPEHLSTSTYTCKGQAQLKNEDRMSSLPIPVIHALVNYHSDGSTRVLCPHVRILEDHKQYCSAIHKIASTPMADMFRDDPILNVCPYHKLLK